MEVSKGVNDTEISKLLLAVEFLQIVTQEVKSNPNVVKCEPSIESATEGIVKYAVDEFSRLAGSVAGHFVMGMAPKASVELLLKGMRTDDE